VVKNTTLIALMMTTQRKCFGGSDRMIRVLHDPVSTGHQEIIGTGQVAHM
jgi:hypothetical protein